MKYLFFMDVFIFGGVEKMLKDVTDELIENGEEVDLLLLDKSSENTYLEMLSKKIKVHYLLDNAKKGRISQKLSFWKNVCFPKAVLRRFDFNGYDCVICFKDDYQTNILATKMPLPKIAWVHNLTQDFVKKPIKSIKYKFAFRAYSLVNKKYLKTFSKFDKVVFVSNHAKDALLKRCKKPLNSTVIYNYINVNEVMEKSSEKVADDFSADINFCYVGRLTAEKGLFEIVDSFCRLPKTEKKVNLILVGEGYMKDELLEIVKKYDCESSVRFLGTKENPYPYIKNSDVILCASHKESFGLVVLESLVLGKCVVSTCCGGPEELIIDKKTGYLVKDYQEFHNLLKGLCSGEVPLLNGDMHNEKYKEFKKEFFKSFYKIVSEIKE